MREQPAARRPQPWERAEANTHGPAGRGTARGTQSLARYAAIAFNPVAVIFTENTFRRPTKR
jgi:hypothetical protein